MFNMTNNSTSPNHNNETTIIRPSIKRSLTSYSAHNGHDFERDLTNKKLQRRLKYDGRHTTIPDSNNRTKNHEFGNRCPATSFYYYTSSFPSLYSTFSDKGLQLIGDGNLNKQSQAYSSTKRHSQDSFKPHSVNQTSRKIPESSRFSWRNVQQSLPPTLNNIHSTSNLIDTTSDQNQSSQNIKKCLLKKTKATITQIPNRPVTTCPSRRLNSSLVKDLDAKIKPTHVYVNSMSIWNGPKLDGIMKTPVLAYPPVVSSNVLQRNTSHSRNKTKSINNCRVSFAQSYLPSSPPLKTKTTKINAVKPLHKTHAKLKSNSFIDQNSSSVSGTLETESNILKSQEETDTHIKSDSAYKSQTNTLESHNKVESTTTVANHHKNLPSMVPMQPTTPNMSIVNRANPKLSNFLSPEQLVIRESVEKVQRWIRTLPKHFHAIHNVYLPVTTE